jgi:hypothetical protein
MNLNVDLLTFFAVLSSLAWTMHHFKRTIQFGKGIGRLYRILNFIRQKIFKISGEFKAPGYEELQRLYERGIAVIVMFASGAATLAFAGMLTVVWTFAETWVLALLGAALVGALWMWHMIIRGNGHHVTRSTAVAALYGILMALTWGGWAGLHGSADKALNALENVSQHAATGHAAVASKSTPTGAEHLAAIVFLIVVGVLVLIVAGSIRKERKANKPAKAGRRGGTAPVSGGPGRSALGGSSSL